MVENPKHGSRLEFYFDVVLDSMFGHVLSQDRQCFTKLHFLTRLRTQTSTEGFYKLFHAATALDARATVLSVDVLGAYDHVSCQAMLEVLLSRPALACPPVLWQCKHVHLARRDQHGGGWAARGCKRVRPSSRSSATILFCQHQSAPVRCTAPWRTRCTRIRLNQGKTPLRKAAGEEPIAALPVSNQMVSASILR